jgi:hypothetical protein
MTTSNTASTRESIITVIVLINVILISEAYTTGNADLYWALLFSLPVLLIAVRERRDKKRKAVKGFLPTGRQLLTD